MPLKRKITKEDCNNWNKNKNINPLTNRIIKSNSVLYKTIETNCDKYDIIKIVNDFCKLNNIKSNINSKYKKIYNNINILCDNINPIMNKSLNKFDKYKIILNYFKDIKLSSNKCIELYKEQNKYLLSNDILLYKKIGSASAFGVVYKSMNININYNIPKFVIKLQLNTKEMKNELDTFKKISDYAIKYNVPNFPILYKSIICDNIIRNSSYPDLLAKSNKKNKKYSIIIYELAKGDLKSFLNNNKSLSEKIWKNIYEQIFMSILLLHSLNIIHNDTHYGNFLYIKIKEGGCFHYKINDDDYYIENIGYIWMIWDFGNSRELSKVSKGLFIEDYMLINLFMRKRDLEMEKNKDFKNHNIYGNNDRYAGYMDDTITIPNSIIKLQEKLWKHLGELINHYSVVITHRKNLTEYLWFKYFIDNNLLFSKTPIGDIISSVIINI